MEKTVDDLIKELQALKPSLRSLPVVVVAENGLLLPATIKINYGGILNFDTAKNVVITD